MKQRVPARPPCARRPSFRPQLEGLEELTPPNNMFGLAWDFGLGDLAAVPFVTAASLRLGDVSGSEVKSTPAVVTPTPAAAVGQPAAGQAGAARPAPAADVAPCEGYALQTITLGGGGGSVMGPGMADLAVDGRTLGHQRFESRTFAAGSCSIAEGHVPGPGTWRLMRFTTTYPNIGASDLAIGNPLAHPDLFEYDTCHGHYHFKEYADYRLWTNAGYQQWRALRDSTPESTLSRDLLNANPGIKSQMIEGAKRGFCVIDIRRVPGVDGPRQPQYTSCSANQGISVGWADEYHWSLDGQWINVTNVAAGNYMLEVEVNAEHLFAEGNYANNDTAVSVRIR